ncbi:MAG: hypothetical protein MJA29_03190, partial [Candidatus Omnitrophica bacterium]|nr:hypothetical protein [Candidatus Omnitrophota bacterium]
MCLGSHNANGAAPFQINKIKYVQCYDVFGDYLLQVFNTIVWTSESQDNRKNKKNCANAIGMISGDYLL